MSEKIKVFISYSHLDIDLMEKVREKLNGKTHEGNEIEILTDEKTTHSDDLHKEVSKLINQSHIVTPILTNNWLSSNEARDELVRAHERRKMIIGFYNKEEIPSPEAKIVPFYLRDKKNFPFIKDTMALAVTFNDLFQAIFSYKSFWKFMPLENIRKLGDAVDFAEQRGNVMPFEEKLLNVVLHKTHNEINKLILNSTFTKKVSHEENFLIAASPFFSTAEKIRATSIAKISTFWSDRNSHNAVVDYLQTQKDKNVIRLFVFDSPAEANDFKSILNANHAYYGFKEGGVFFTSKNHYRELLNNRISRDAGFLRDVEDRDFGILTYKEGVTLTASLDSTKLSISPADKPLEVSLISFLDTFEDFKNITPGSFSQEFNIARWSESFKDTEVFSNTLKKLFPEKNTNILHLVLIKVDSKQQNAIRDCLMTLKTNFERAKEELSIKQIWIQNKHDIVCHDGLHHGVISTSKDYDFIIVVEFENDAALKTYYQHPVHSIEREKLYLTINPHLESKYEALRNLRGTTNTNNKKELYEQIESEVSKNILRIDFRIEDPINELVKKPGISFIPRYNL